MALPQRWINVVVAILLIRLGYFAVGLFQTSINDETLRMLAHVWAAALGMWMLRANTHKPPDVQLTSVQGKLNTIASRLDRKLSRLEGRHPKDGQEAQSSRDPGVSQQLQALAGARSGASASVSDGGKAEAEPSPARGFIKKSDDGEGPAGVAESRARRRLISKQQRTDTSVADNQRSSTSAGGPVEDQEPQEPGPNDCCQAGCQNCVWTVYKEQHRKWKERQTGQAIPEDPFVKLERELAEKAARLKAEANRREAGAKSMEDVE